MRAYVTPAIDILKRLTGDAPNQAIPRSVVIFVGAFFYFLCSQLMTNSTFVYQLGFYGLLLPSFLYLAIKQRHLLSRIPYTVGTLGLMAFFCFVLLHGALGQFADQSFTKTLREVMLNGAFLLMALIIFTTPRIDSLTLLRGLIVTTVVMIPISYAMYVYDPSQTEHFLPIGRAHNPIPIGNLYAFAAVIALWLFFQQTTSSRWKILCGLCYTLAVLAIIITTQRGPLLGLAAASGVAALLFFRPRYILLASLPVLIGCFDYWTFYRHGTGFLHLDALHSTITHFFTQRDSIRLTIWHHAFELIAQQPWRGHGLHAKFIMAGLPGAVNPHNLFISTLYYLGIVGLGLLLVPLFAAFMVALRGRNTPYHQLCLLLLVHAVAATFTNYGQVIQSPSPLWTIYWLPMVMALARPPAKQ